MGCQLDSVHVDIVGMYICTNSTHNTVEKLIKKSYQMFFLSGFVFYIHIHYYSKSNNALKQQFVSRVFV